jgi:ribosome-binding factor A
MPREYPRSHRIADQIQRDLAQVIQREMNDPRVSMLTISGVDVSRDLAVARVYVTSLQQDVDMDSVIAVLNRAAGFLRHQLGRHLRLRNIPELRFSYDESIQRGIDMSRLIDEVIADDEKSHK